MADEHAKFTFSLFAQRLRGFLLSVAVKYRPNGAAHSNLDNSQLMVLYGSSVAFQIKMRKIQKFTD